MILEPHLITLESLLANNSCDTYIQVFVHNVPAFVTPIELFNAFRGCGQYESTHSLIKNLLAWSFLPLKLKQHASKPE